MSKKTKKTLVTLVIAIGILLVLFLFHLINTRFPNNVLKRTLNGLSLVLTPALIALVITYLVNPIADFFHIRLKVSKLWTTIITLLLVIIVLGGIGYLIVNFIIEQGENFFNTVFSSDFIIKVEEWFKERGLENVFNQIYDYFENFDITVLLSPVSSILSMLTRTLTILILIPIFLFHFLYAKEQIYEGVINAFPEKWQTHLRPITAESNIMIMQYFRSKLLSMAFLFVVFSFLYLILGIPIGYVLFFAMLLALLDLIPYIGPTVANLIPIIYVASVGGLSPIFMGGLIPVVPSVIILLIGNFIIQAVQGNIVIPKIAGKEMNINALLILVSMLFFGSILGVWGIVLSIPLCGFLIILFRYMKRNKLFFFEEE